MSILRDLATALTFLTRLPVSRLARGGPSALARATTWFPLVGLIIGSALALAVLTFDAVLPTGVAVVIVLALGVLLTGGLHEDGLADVADSAGAFSVEKKLAVMRDSRVGTYGVLALVILLAARYAVVGELAVTDWTVVIAALVAAHVLSRWSSVLLMAWLPSARTEGANTSTAQGVTGAQLLRSTAVAGICMVPVAILDGPSALLAVPVALAVTTLAGLWFRRTFGGITGDCLGAATIAVEISVLIAVVALSV
ncbi:MAG: adenosylcobinamide-GDP ribazoletransferase [Ornithinimicrobium sp.]